MVWLVLDKNVCTEEERDAAWEIVKGKKFKSSISPTDKYTEFVNLFGTYGRYSLEPHEPEAEISPIPELANLSMESLYTNGFGVPQQNGNRRPRPTVHVDSRRSHTASPVENPQTPVSAATTSSPRSHRGQHNRRGSFRPNQSFQGQQPAPSSPVDQGTYRQDAAPDQQQSNGYRGRGRGRGQHRGRGRGRGRGQPPMHTSPAPAPA
uniref:Autophagy-related protein 2 n=1 Tax=Ganoderma boninense TaxID=34458 RepID=A0A5K1K194_9APHY|nr:Autophagy-related protein 2 [Ganoderma boninense]